MICLLHSSIILIDKFHIKQYILQRKHTMKNQKFIIKNYFVLLLILVAVLCCSLLALCACHINDDDSTEPPTDPSGHSHSYSQSVTKQPTCTETGIRTFLCACGDSYTEVISANGHSLKFADVDGGSEHWQECENCDYVTEKVAHDYKTVVSTELSSCTQKGFELRKCECGAMSKRELPLIAHKFTKQDFDESGHYMVCSVCSTQDPNSVEVHQYNTKITIQLTCTQNEVTKFSCDCGYSYSETTKVAQGHQLDKTQFTKRTPTGHYYKCDNCGNDVVEQHVSVDAECPDGYNREATCYKEGHQDKQCTVCNLVYHETTPITGEHNFAEEWSHTGTFHWHACLNGDGACTAKSEEAQHVFKTVRQDPTCTEAGFEEKQCECGTVQSGSHHTLSIIAHDYEETVTTVATCTQAGEVHKVCRVCGDTVDEVVEQLKHDWTEWTGDETQHWHICSNCGTEQTSKGNHDFRKRETVAATCTEDGYIRYECTACQREKREVIAAHHNYYSTDEGRVDPTCTEFGTHVEICSVCGYRITVEDVSLGYADHLVAYHEAKELTDDEDGNINYWKCSVCGKYFSSHNCEIELTESDVFIRVPRTQLFQTIAELEEIALRDYVDEASRDWYQITLYIFDVSDNSYMCLFDEKEDLIEAYFPKDVYNFVGLVYGDEVVVRGHLIAIDGEVQLLDAQLLSVYCDDPELVNLFFAVSGDLHDAQLYTISESGEYLSIVYYGGVQNLYNFNCLIVGESLTVYSYNYHNLVIKYLVINGVSYTMTKGELTLKVTQDIYVEIEFGYYDENNLTLSEIDTSWNADVKVNPYVAYTSTGGNGSGHIVKNSILKFYVQNAYITRIIIEFEDYQLTTVKGNTISVGKDEAHKSSVSYEIGTDRKTTIRFDKSQGLQFFEYRANAGQARIVSIKIYYNTYNS